MKWSSGLSRVAFLATMSDPMDIDLVSFIQTGRLGGLSLGLSKADIVALLGPPNDVAGGRRAPEILKYGDVQIMLKAGQATFLSVTPSDPRSSDTRYVGWRPTPATTFAECHAVLAAIPAGAHLEAPMTGGSFKTLTVQGSGVRIAFVDDQLDKLYVTSEGPRVRW